MSQTLPNNDPGGTQTVPHVPEAEIADAGGAPEAARGVAPNTEGNSLCNSLSSTGCYPDMSVSARACGLAPDGGVYSAAAGYSESALACHVQRSSADAGVHPVCSTAGQGIAGMPCAGPTDCAATYECIGDGTCAHYCCAGLCSTNQFCDIQPLAVDSTVHVPVCMSVTPKAGCQLLNNSSCPAGSTCAVVRQDGQTSCVAIGKAKVKAPCDAEHCAQGLTCVGSPGQRRCFQLCDTTTSAGCSAPQTCKGGLPLFRDPETGICQ
ncbi:MAG: hypothetical protein M3O36_03370 [Myxococcota bacterium]|nr:hypothetical protein [Myxococcota bacterium]